MSQNPPAVDAKAAILKPEVLAMRDRLKKAIKIDPTTGTGVVEKDLYANTLPEGITPQIVKQLQDHNSLVAAGGALAVGELAIEQMKSNAGLQRAQVVLPMIGKDTLEYTFDRTKQVPNRTENGLEGTKAKFGVMTTVMRVYGTRDRGEMAKVREMLNANATAELDSEKK